MYNHDFWGVVSALRTQVRSTDPETFQKKVAALTERERTILTTVLDALYRNYPITDAPILSSFQEITQKIAHMSPDDPEVVKAQGVFFRALRACTEDTTTSPERLAKSFQKFAYDPKVAEQIFSAESEGIIQKHFPTALSLSQARQRALEEALDKCSALSYAFQVRSPPALSEVVEKLKTKLQSLRETIMSTPPRMQVYMKMDQELPLLDHLEETTRQLGEVFQDLEKGIPLLRQIEEGLGKLQRMVSPEGNVERAIEKMQEAYGTLAEEGEEWTAQAREIKQDLDRLVALVPPKVPLPNSEAPLFVSDEEKAIYNAWVSQWEILSRPLCLQLDQLLQEIEHPPEGAPADVPIQRIVEGMSQIEGIYKEISEMDSSLQIYMDTIRKTLSSLSETSSPYEKNAAIQKIIIAFKKIRLGVEPERVARNLVQKMRQNALSEKNGEGSVKNNEREEVD